MYRRKLTYFRGNILNKYADHNKHVDDFLNKTHDSGTIFTNISFYFSSIEIDKTLLFICSVAKLKHGEL